MLILVFDTETTGLPKARKLENHNLHLWPYIVQFSYVLYDTSSNNVTKIVDEIIKIPDNIDIPEDTIKIHGITKMKSNKLGKNIEDLLLSFYQDFKMCDSVVAHNLQFDLNMINAELLRIINRDNSYTSRLFDSEIYNDIYNSISNSKKLYCTMQETIEYCNIKKQDKNGKEFIKFPKLSELYEKMFGYIPKNLHNSLNDVVICLRCFMMWKYNIDVMENNDVIKSFISDNLINDKILIN